MSKNQIFLYPSVVKEPVPNKTHKKLKETGTMTKEIKLNKQQCEEIALTIFADIEQYIAEHQAEFEEFLKMEMA